jgi:hypothetical protein
VLGFGGLASGDFGSEDKVDQDKPDQANQGIQEGERGEPAPAETWLENDEREQQIERDQRQDHDQ